MLVYVPVSGEAPVPSPQSTVAVRPSCQPGSVTVPSIWIAWFSTIVDGAVKAAVGATLVTETVVEAVSVDPAPSVTRTLIGNEPSWPTVVNDGETPEVSKNPL